MDNKQYGDELFIYAMVLIEEAELDITETQEQEGINVKFAGGGEYEIN